MADPLTRLPPELVLQILGFAPISTLAALTRTSQGWYKFIDATHQEAIYSSSSKTLHPPGAKDFEFLRDTTSFSRYYDGVSSWKDLCKRQTLLARNWDDEKPTTHESVLQIGDDPVWRFRMDFKRRFILSTSQSGGLNVTDMESGELLWQLSPDQVKPYAHLEYQDGTAVWDREGDAVEVWKHDVDGTAHGEFQRIAVLPHHCQTRGFQLSYNTLCVVSTEGKGFVYDFKQTPPQLTKEISIPNNAVGHLDQNEDVVMYSMGEQGYHFYDKATGKALGVLLPSDTEFFCHINHPTPSTAALLPSDRHGRTTRAFPPEAPRTDRLAPVTINPGRFRGRDAVPESIEDDEWGAGMLCGDIMAGVSRGGRAFVCHDWRLAIRNPEQAVEYFTIIECAYSENANFDLGGWLSIRNNRIVFEIKDAVYVVALDEILPTQQTQHPRRGSYLFSTSSVPRLTVPVSFMALFDDCIVHTYTTLGLRQRGVADGDGQIERGLSRFFPTKAIRVLSMAPNLSGEEGSRTLWQQQPQATEFERAEAGLLQLVSMLGEESEDEDEDFNLTTVEAGDDLM